MDSEKDEEESASETNTEQISEEVSQSQSEAAGEFDFEELKSGERIKVEKSPSIKVSPEMEFEEADEEAKMMLSAPDKVTDSSMDSQDTSNNSVRVIEFNEDGSIKKKKMKDHVLEMVDLKKPMNRLGEVT